MSVENVVLTDEATGSRAAVLAGFGFNCYEFKASVDGRIIDVLWSAPGFESGNERPSGSGIPLLFPFPGRLRGTKLAWDGEQYDFDGGDGRGNAIHGFVLSRPWRVIEQSKAKVVGQFQASIDDPKILKQWPADFRVTATYELVGNCLKSNFLFENPGDKPLPCGFGTHPYFRLPLGGDDANSCRVSIPATKHWELVDMLPTGKCADLEEAASYQNGLAFEGMSLDDVFGGLVFEDGDCVSQIVDSKSNVQLSMKFDSSFRELVVYTPPHREAVCVEPYTCVPGMLGGDTPETEFGLRVLQPGESFSSRVEMEVSKA